MKKDYVVKVTGWISGTHHEAGAKLQMTAAAAEYYLLNGQVAEDVSPAAPAPKKGKGD